MRIFSARSPVPICERRVASSSARLYERELERRRAELDATRRSQIGTGERAEKIRTYNVPQDRLTDHRIGLDLHNLPGVMDGDIDKLIEALSTTYQAEMLRVRSEGAEE